MSRGLVSLFFDKIIIEHRCDSKCCNANFLSSEFNMISYFEECGCYMLHGQNI